MDEELEMAIDETGRERVFAAARTLGWSPRNCPPKWVWWSIIAEVRTEMASEADALLERTLATPESPDD